MIFKIFEDFATYIITMDLIKTKKSALMVYNIKDKSDLIKACVDDVDDQLLEYPPIIVYGKKLKQRRCVGFFSDTSKGYEYSGQTADSKPLTENLKVLLDFINEKFKSKFNGILVNKYKDGNDYLSAHSDDERNLDDCGVVAISYGATRKFRIRDMLNRIVMDVPTKTNQIIHMEGDFQKEFKHEIPVEKRVKDTRYSFTFRKHLK